MRTLLLACLLAASPLARGEDATVAAAPDPGGAAGTPAPGSRLGLQVESGLPDGLAVALTFRPIPALRLSAGPAWNYVSFGGQVGATIVPFRWAIAPTLSAEAGRYFRADLSRFVNAGTGAPKEIEPLLKNVSYDYAAAHLGIELGSRRGLAFSLRAGLAYVRMVAHGRTQPTGTIAPGGAQVTFVDPRLNATIPSVKLGLQYSF
jgi:hypothetical protein